MAKQSPCKGCPDRKAGCHCTCPDYLDFKTENDAERERIRRIQDAENDYMNFKTRTVAVASRRKYGKWG